MALILERNMTEALPGMDPGPKYMLDSSPVSFFPLRDVVNGLGLKGPGDAPLVKVPVVGCVVVKSFDDPAVNVIREGIKKVRAGAKPVP